LKNPKQQIIDKFIKWSLSKLNQWNQYRIKKYGTKIIDNPNNYEVLLPNAKSDEKGYYSDALGVALNTPKVNNIAITGAYGSGKSSFLETFKNNNAEWNYLLVSLATFKNKKEDENEKSEEEENEEKGKFELHQDIERSILQQFFYREKSSTVPQSRFKKIKRIKKFDVFSNTLMFTFLISWTAIIFNHFKEKDKLQLWDFTTTYFNEISVVYLLIGLAFFYRIFYYISSLEVSKLNVKKGEITLAKQDKASILNEHLDEILYFFEATQYNVVFFEDIDRFDDTEIFIKLRELNNLINNSKQIGREIKFIYAIRDDMFIDKERTKFFDFIVPIIPYINPSNSEMKLIKKFEKEIEDKKIDENFISQVSLYIDDMRLLLNIYNEYMVYKKNLDSDKLNHNQILALVICKNFYPLEFAKLHNREGIIYDLVENKPQYVKAKIEELNNKKVDLQTEIKNIENENISSLNELRMIYLYALFSKISTNSVTVSIRGQRRSWSLSDLNSDEVFEDIVVNNTSFMSNNNYNQYKFSEIEKEVNANQTYIERKSFIENKSNNKINDLKREIEDINKQIAQLKEATLEELFETSADIIIKGYEDKQLLIFAVRNGYIDEYYEHYISHFYEGGITQDDRDFLLSIQDHKALESTFRLGNIRKLIDKLKIKNFKQKEIWNYHLTDFLLANYSQYEDKASFYVKKLSENSKESKEFILTYLDQASRSHKKDFIRRLKWDGLWLYVFDELSDKKQDEYFKLIFDALDVENIVKLNKEHKLKEYLENQTYLPKYTDESNKKCKALIEELELDFTNINNPSENKELFEYIYENWNYQLNNTMIKIMLNEKANISMDDLEKAHLTTVRESGAEELIAYINSNIDEYVENIFLALESNTQESEETVIELLNNEEVSLENKIKIIQKEEVRITDINAIKNKELWVELFKSNKVEATWDNVMQYYLFLDSELDNDLVVFLDKKENAENLSTVIVDATYCENNEEFNTKILRDIIELNEFKIESYEYLIKNLGYWYKDLDISALDEEKIKLLVQDNRCQFEKECFDTLKKHTNSQHIALIENNKTKLLEKLEEFELDADDVLMLLSSEVFKEEKYNIIEGVDINIFEEHQALQEKVSIIYIDDNKHIENNELFEKLFYSENKYDLGLLVSQIEYFENCESIKKYLNEFNSPFDELINRDASRLYLDDNSINRQLLDKLKNKDCISSWREHKNNLGKNELKVERKRV